MGEDQVKGNSEHPAVIFLIDPAYDVETFDFLIRKCLEELQAKGGSVSGVLPGAMESVNRGQLRIRDHKKFLLAFCWDSELSAVLPFVSDGFTDQDTDTLDQVARKIARLVQLMRLNHFELRFLNEHNPLLMYAIQAALELKLLTMTNGEG